MHTKSLLFIQTRLSMVLIFVFGLCACSKDIPCDNHTGFYNFDTSLHSSDSKDPANPSFGFLKFRQDPDTARIITLDTYIFNLLPNHDYVLQRAVNPITAPDCTSTAWLTLGLGLLPQSIHTDSRGNGHEKLFRNITGIARGSEFRIHFQILDTLSKTAVLFSDCERYTVR